MGMTPKQEVAQSPRKAWSPDMSLNSGLINYPLRKLEGAVTQPLSGCEILGRLFNLSVPLLYDEMVIL